MPFPGSNTEVSISTPWGIHKGKADVSGKWQIGFSTPNENPSFSIDVCANSECIKINNVVLGEVWLASGQSNMEMPLKGWPPSEPILNSANEIAQAGNYELRFFSVERDLSNLPLDDVSGKWLVSDSINAADFSATAYFFAKELFQELHVPIGIVDSSWGGTPVEAWTGINALGETQLYDDKLANFSGFDGRLAGFKQWLAPLSYFPMPGVNSTHTDWKELPFNDMEYANETFDDSEWFTIEFPGNFNDVFGETVVNDFDGVVWIRKSFYLEDLDDAYFLDLGLVDDMDFTYINGVFVGASFQAESFREKRYTIPAEVLKQGKNTISIRLIDTMGPARVWSPISIKSSNSLHYVLAKAYATKHDFSDVILMNTSDEIAEFSSSNLFIDLGDQIITPPLSSGCLDGIIRRQLLKPNLSGLFNIQESVIKEQDLLNAQSIYGTNTNAGIFHITKYKEKAFGPGKANKIQSKLNKL